MTQEICWRDYGWNHINDDLCSVVVMQLEYIRTWNGNSIILIIQKVKAGRS